MTKPRKILVAFLLFLSILVPVWSTGYPVIDISAIMNAIAEFSTTVQQYQRQIMQWKSEYDRLAKAAKTMAKGDFNSILDGISQAATAISGYGEAFSGLAQVSAAISSGQKLAKDGQQMVNSVESTWQSFLQQVDSVNGAEDAIDLMWDFMALSPLADTLAASDILTSDFLNDSYIKKLKGNEYREKILKEKYGKDENGKTITNEDKINEMSKELADAIKKRDDLKTAKAAADESVVSMNNSAKDAMNAWLYAQKQLSELNIELQESIASDGEVESNETKGKRAAVDAKTADVNNLYDAWLSAIKKTEEAEELAEKTQKDLDSSEKEYLAKKNELENFVAEITYRADNMDEADKSIEKMGEAYRQVQAQRAQAYIEAHTFTEIPSTIPAEAKTEGQIRYYMKYGTLSGYRENAE